MPSKVYIKKNHFYSCVHYLHCLVTCVPEAAAPSGTSGLAVVGTGWGQQNQTFRFMPVSQPEVVGIQKHGPYRRIKPITLSKSISSCEYILVNTIVGFFFDLGGGGVALLTI